MSNYTTIRTPNRPAVGTVRTANEWGAASNAAYLRVAFEPVKLGSSWAVTLEPCDAPAEREPTIAEVHALREEVRQMKAHHSAAGVPNFRQRTVYATTGRPMNCRQCGKWHAFAPSGPPLRVLRCECGSIYASYPDRIHHAAWGTTYTGPLRLDIRKLPALPGQKE